VGRSLPGACTRIGQEMANTQKNRDKWKLSWRKHRQEFAPWLIGVVFYLIFMKNVEHSRGTYLVLAVVFFAPPIIIARIIWTAMRKSGEDI